MPSPTRKAVLPKVPPDSTAGLPPSAAAKCARCAEEGRLCGSRELLVEEGKGKSEATACCCCEGKVDGLSLLREPALPLGPLGADDEAAADGGMTIKGRTGTSFGVDPASPAGPPLLLLPPTPPNPAPERWKESARDEFAAIGGSCWRAEAEEDDMGGSVEDEEEEDDDGWRPRVPPKPTEEEDKMAADEGRLCDSASKATPNREASAVAAACARRAAPIATPALPSPIMRAAS